MRISFVDEMQLEKNKFDYAGSEKVSIHYQHIDLDGTVRYSKDYSYEELLAKKGRKMDDMEYGSYLMYIRAVNDGKAYFTLFERSAETAYRKLEDIILSKDDPIAAGDLLRYLKEKVGSYRLEIKVEEGE